MSELNNLGKGIGLCAFAAFVLIILKMAGVIGWPWIWVMIPLWGPAALLIIALLIIMLLMAVAKFVGWVVKKL